MSGEDWSGAAAEAVGAMLSERIDALKAEVEWWKEATEIKREQAKKLRALSARRGRELKQLRLELTAATRELRRLRLASWEHQKP